MKILKFSLLATAFTTFLTSSLVAENITIFCDENPPVNIYVDLAQKPEEHYEGLKHRPVLLQNHGMLFLYQKPRTVAMWMKDTKIPLDIIFATSTGYIQAIHENARPNSTDIIGNVPGTAQVLEVPAGTVARHKITTGCKIIRHPNGA